MLMIRHYAMPDDAMSDELPVYDDIACHDATDATLPPLSPRHLFAAHYHYVVSIAIG